MQVKVSFIIFVLCRNKLLLSLQELNFHFHLCWSHQLVQMDIEFNYEAVFLVRRTENSAMFSNEFGTGSKPVGIVLQAWVEPRFGWFYAFESQFAKLLKWALPNMWVSPERFHLFLWRTCCEHLCPIIQPGITFLHGVALSSVINPPTGSFSLHCHWVFSIKAQLVYHLYCCGTHRPAQSQCYWPTRDHISY